MVRRFLGLAVATIIVVPLLGATPSEQPSYYVALGDSLAVGYQPDPDAGRHEGYVPRVHQAISRDRALTLRNLGCNGATTTTLRNGGGCAYEGADSQLAAAEQILRQHRGRIRLVTIDIGANDLNRCSTGGTIDSACALAALGTVATNLGQIVRRLRQAAPQVRILGMTYYNPYAAAWLGGAGGQALTRQSLQLTVLLNQVLTGVYTAADVRVADVAAAFAMTDLTTLVPLPNGVQVPLAVARVCQWTWMCPAAGRSPDIHPTTAGYRVIADAFLAQAGRRRALAPTG
jgi:lysophospholipase L1-like esterase